MLHIKGSSGENYSLIWFPNEKLHLWRTGCIIWNVKPCFVQSSYLTMSWLPLLSVGTACSIHILHSNTMLKSCGLTHVDHYLFDIDSIFCECQTTEARKSNVWMTFASAKLECSNISNLDPGLILIAFASTKLECSNISNLGPGI